MKTIIELKKYLLKNYNITFDKIKNGYYLIKLDNKSYNFFTQMKVAETVEYIYQYIEKNGIDNFLNKDCKEIITINRENIIDVESLPKEFDNYFFPDFIKNIARRINNGKNMFFTGEAGSGKTECVKALAKFCNIPLLSVDFHVGTNSNELIGKFIVKNGATQFVYGIIPQAMKNGWWLNLNEIDYATPEHLAVMQGILTGDNLIISQNENEVITPHKNFRIFATANTKGRGTDTGYVGSNFLNLAFLDRFSMFEFSYTKEEVNIINKIINDMKLSEMLVNLFNNLRIGAKEGKILNAVFTTRRLKDIAQSLACGETFYDAIYYDLITRYDYHEQGIIKEFVNDVFDNATYIKAKWRIGNKHFVPKVDDDNINNTQ